MTTTALELPRTRRIYRGSATPTVILATAYYGMDGCSVCRDRIREESRFYRLASTFSFRVCLRCADCRDVDAD